MTPILLIQNADNDYALYLSGDIINYYFVKKKKKKKAKVTLKFLSWNMTNIR